jgi:short-subunit dehydrogenase
MISEGYVQNGAKVYISSRDAKACEQACKELNALGKGSAYAIPADFYKEADCKKLAEELAKRETSKFFFSSGFIKGEGGREKDMITNQSSFFFLLIQNYTF